MLGVFVVPLYLEIPDGFERAVAPWESHLPRAGYAFYMAEPLPVALERRKETCSFGGRVVTHSG